jgi:D-serine deaminase-like pyridoxal phosphate-dependent protein
MHPDLWLSTAVGCVQDTPALAVSPERVQSNVARVAAVTREHGKQLRPHVKTHKMAAVARLQLAEGAFGLQVAKLGEAEAGAVADARSVLVGFPLVGEPKLARLAELARQRSVLVGLDSLDVAKGISAFLRDKDARVGILIDVDTGLHRVGVRPEDVGELGAAIQPLPGLDLVGVMTHEGHIAGQGRNETHMRELVHQAAADVTRAGAALRGLGVSDPVVSMGCTPTWRFAVEEPGVTELRPGTYVFYDMNCVRNGAARLSDVAAAVVATVVSVATGRGEFVVDAGSKSLASELRKLPDGTTSFASVPELGGSVVRLSEEHGIVAGARRLPRIGQRVAVVPNHICPVVNLFDEAVTVAGDGATGAWPVTARGRVR